MKWVLIGLGALVVYQLVKSQSASTGGGFLSGGKKTDGGFTGVVDSLTGLTNAIGKLFTKESTSVRDPDGLANPFAGE